MIELGIPPLIFQQALQLVALHFRYTVLHTNTVAAKLYNLRHKFRCSNAHPQHTIEDRIAKAHSTLIISSTYPDPPLVPRSVTLAKSKNKGKSYTTFLKSANGYVGSDINTHMPLKPPPGMSLHGYMLTSSSTTSPIATTYTNSAPISQCIGTTTLCPSSDSGSKAANPSPLTCSP